MLKPGDPAFDKLVADLKSVTSSRYAEQFLWSVDDTTVLAKGDSGARFERLHATEQTEVVKWSIEWSHYENQGLSRAQADAIFRNVQDGKPPERWLEGVFDEAFKAVVEDMTNNRAPKEMDGIRQIWAGLSPAAKLQTIAREAARHHVPFEPFAETVKNTIGDMGEAALRVVLDNQKELHAIAKLFPDHAWTEPAPLIEQVKEMLDRVSALETQEKERHQGREKLFEGISDVLDGKPPQAWSDAAKAFRDILREGVPRAESAKTQERGGREM